RVVVDRVWRGRMCLRVVPLDPALAPSAVLTFDADDPGPRPVHVEVDRLPSRRVRVVKADDQPVAGATVELVRKGTQPFGPRAETRATGVYLSRSEPDAQSRAHEQLAAATTAADGRATLWAPPLGDGLAVRVWIPGHATVVVDPAVFAADQELVVRLAAAGNVVGTIDLPGYAPGMVCIGLLPADGQRASQWADQ